MKAMLIAAILVLFGLPPALANEKTVNITAAVKTVEVLHQGRKVSIERNPDPDNMVDPDYSLTSRPCPPYCIQPMQIAPGVETIGELELIDYLKKVGKDFMVIDSRDGDWPLRSGVIPGAVVIPWQELHPAHSDTEKIAETLVLRFGAARQEGSSWKGLFIRAPAGSDVKAIAGGQVVFAEWMRGFGNLLIVDHGGGYLSVYGNNDALVKQSGDAVRGGDVIAAVGNSGGNPESGLYFELRYQGQAMDPLKWVSLK